MPPRVAASFLLAVVLSLSACAAPDLGSRPRMNAPAAFASVQSLRAAQAAPGWPRERWWTSYGDPRLDALVEEALAGSPSVALAEARIRTQEQAAAA